MGVSSATIGISSQKCHLESHLNVIVPHMVISDVVFL